MIGIIILFCISVSGLVIIFYLEVSRRRDSIGKVRINEFSKSSRPSSNISVIRKNPKPAAEITHPVFQNKQVADFYLEVICGRRLKDPYLAVIVQILNILDQFGDCPSVVNNYRNSKAPNSFDFLSQINLREHSMGVAKMILKNMSPVIYDGDALIVALAHDIGKLPIYHHGEYCTGDHPLLSVAVLSGFLDYRRIVTRKIIDQAISNHHYISLDPLASRLKDADKSARSFELCQRAEIFFSEGRRPMTTHSNFKETTEHPMDLESFLENKSFYENGNHSPVPLDISSWFDATATLAAISGIINQVVDGRWKAVSTPEGFVFFSRKGFWIVLNKVHRRNPTLMAAWADCNRRHDILYSAIHALDVEKNAVATELLMPNQYACQVKLTSGSGNSIPNGGFPLLLIPFRAVAFGLDPNELEAEKSITICRMVGTITPVVRGNVEMNIVAETM